MALLAGHQANFETLRRAFLAGDVALVECRRTDTDQPVAVVCAVQRLADERVTFIPFAMFLDTDPYTVLTPPMAAPGP